jgi:hypothetical protein
MLSPPAAATEPPSANSFPHYDGDDDSDDAALEEEFMELVRDRTERERVGRGKRERENRAVAS